MSRVMAALSVLVLAGAAGVAAPAAPPVRADPGNLRREVSILASDALRGRAPWDGGYRLAANHVEQVLRRLGLHPAGGGFQHPVPLEVTRPVAGSCRLELRRFGREETFELGSHMLLLAGGEETWLGSWHPVVFAGYGIVAPEFDWNDFRGIDVEGAVVVAVAGEPPSSDDAFFGGAAPTVHAAPETKLRQAASRGAAGLLLVHDPLGVEPGLSWERLRRDLSRPLVALPYNTPRIFAAMVHRRVLGALATDALYDTGEIRSMLARNAVRPFRIPAEIRFRGRFVTRGIRSPNVVAILPGSDPVLARQVVVVSAHLDHLGVGEPVDGDPVYNGAVDNALGCAGVLELARLLAAGARPARTVLFLFTTGEEEGLLGSRSFLTDPPVPFGDLVANVNVDGLAFMERFRSVVVVGGALSTLGPTVARVARRLGYTVEDAPPELAMAESFARSDQWAFAEAGIPSVLVGEGLSWEHSSREAAVRRNLAWMARVHHTPFDDPDQPLDFEAAAAHVDLLAAVVRAIADAPERPRWNHGSVQEYRSLLNRASGGVVWP